MFMRISFKKYFLNNTIQHNNIHITPAIRGLGKSAPNSTPIYVLKSHVIGGEPIDINRAPIQTAWLTLRKSTIIFIYQYHFHRPEK